MVVAHIGVIRLIMVMVAQVDRVGALQVIAMVIQGGAVRAPLAKAMQAVAVKVSTMLAAAVVPEAQVDQDEVMEVLTVV
jgi:hypothetical protein